MKKFKDNNKGFSLVELIVVIAIMVVLIAVLGSTILGYVEKSKYSKDISALDSINTAVKTFVADPSSGTGTTYGQYKDGQVYSLSALINAYDQGGVILPIISEVFAVGNKTATSSVADLDKIDFNNSSKAFAATTLSSVKVRIDKGAVSIWVDAADTEGYADYKAGATDLKDAKIEAPAKASK